MTTLLREQASGSFLAKQDNVLNLYSVLDKIFFYITHVTYVCVHRTYFCHAGISKSVFTFRLPSESFSVSVFGSVIILIYLK